MTGVIARSWVALSAVFISGLETRAVPLSFVGIGRSSDFKAIAARYPHSIPRDGYLAVAPRICTTSSRHPDFWHRDHSSGAHRV